MVVTIGAFPGTVEPPLAEAPQMKVSAAALAAGVASPMPAASPAEFLNKVTKYRLHRSTARSFVRMKVAARMRANLVIQPIVDELREDFEDVIWVDGLEQMVLTELLAAILNEVGLTHYPVS
jgi:hypothetical protein